MNFHTKKKYYLHFFSLTVLSVYFPLIESCNLKYLRLNLCYQTIEIIRYYIQLCYNYLWILSFILLSW